MNETRSDNRSQLIAHPDVIAFAPRDECHTDADSRWLANIGATLAHFKRDREDFDRAWSMAVAMHRPPGTWKRHADGECSPLEFFRRQCQGAWTDERVRRLGRAA